MPFSPTIHNLPSHFQGSGIKINLLILDRRNRLFNQNESLKNTRMKFPSCVRIVGLLLGGHAVVLGSKVGERGSQAGLGMSWLLPLESSLISDASRVPDNPRQPLPDDELQAHGTTTLAFISGDGVFLAVDSRASIGKYVGSRTTRKVFPMSRHVVATMAGGAADCTYWIRLCTRIAKLHEYNAGSPLSVASLAAMLAKRLREMRGSSKLVSMCYYSAPLATCS